MNENVKRIAQAFVYAFIGTFATFVLNSGFDISNIGDTKAVKALAWSAAAAALVSAVKAAWMYSPIPGLAPTPPSDKMDV